MLKWGIFGTGFISSQFADGLGQVENSEVYAVASRTQAGADAFAKTAGATKAYGSYQDLIEDETADVFYIGLPNNLHMQIAEALLKRKKHVLCEKPLAMNVKQTEHMVNLARENGVFFMEAMWTRCFPCFKKVLEWVRNGEIGEVNFVEASFGIDSDNAWRQEPQFGGGAILDVGIYPLAATFAILGTDYEEITGLAVLNDKGVDVKNTFSLKYKDGKIANLSSALAHITENRVTIAGTKGQIVIDGEWWHCKHAIKRTGKPKMSDFDFDHVEEFMDDYTDHGNGMHYEAKHVAECIEKGLTESPLYNLDETIKIAKALEALRKQYGVVYTEDE